MHRGRTRDAAFPAADGFLQAKQPHDIDRVHVHFECAADRVVAPGLADIADMADPVAPVALRNRDTERLADPAEDRRRRLLAVARDRQAPDQREAASALQPDAHLVEARQIEAARFQRCDLRRRKIEGPGPVGGKIGGPPDMRARQRPHPEARSATTSLATSAAVIAAGQPA